MKNTYRQFAYLGDRDTVTMWGIDFPRGVAVSVSDAPVIAKLAGNPDFSETVGGVEVLPASAQAPAPTETVRDERGDAYAAKHKGRGKYDVIGPSGDAVESGLSREEAEARAAELNEAD